MRYRDEIFYPQTLAAAKDIVLSPDPLDPQKFEQETRYLITFLKEQDLIRGDAHVLDFGCGMGRLSKALIDTLGCRVTGVDLSENMLYFAKRYVDNPRFMVQRTPEGIFDVALAVLVLQHVEHPEREIACLARSLAVGGKLVVVNEAKRFVPSDIDADGYVIWHDDGIDIFELLKKEFDLSGAFPYYKRNDTPLTVWSKKNVKATP